MSSDGLSTRVFLCLLLLLVSLPGSAIAKRKITVAVVQDGPAPLHDLLLEEMRREFQEITQGEVDVTVDAAPEYNANWDLAQAPEALKRALQNPKVNYVLTLGLEVSTAAGAPDFPLKKPVVAGILYRSGRMFQFALNQNKKSAKKNFSFVMIEEGIAKDIAEFRRMFDFRILHVFRDINYGEHLSRVLQEEVNTLQVEMNMQIKMIDVTSTPDDPNAIIAAVPPDTRFIYLPTLSRLAPQDRAKVIHAVTDRHIPTFSMLGHEDVEIGALAGLTPKLKQRLARRLVLNIQQLILGFSTSDLTVTLPFQEQLLINMETAQKLDYHPDFKTLRGAQLFRSSAPTEKTTLTLESAMQMARTQNIDYLVQQSETRSALYDSRKAMSTLLPQLTARGSYKQIDTDRAQASNGIFPKEETLAGGHLQQVIFNDPLLSAWRSQRRIYQGREYEEEDVQFGAMAGAGKEFLSYTAAVALLKVAENNLVLTRENLDLAVTRSKLGLAGPEEVYRWEAEEAISESRVLERKGDVEQRLVSLNQILGVAQQSRWQPQEIALKEDEMYFLNNGLLEVVKNYNQLEKWRDYSIQKAFENSPTIKLFEKFASAQKITLNQKYRRFFVPEASALFQYDYEVDTDRRSPAGAPPPPFYDEHDWTVGLSATFPLFDGAGKFFDVGREKAQLLKTQRELTRSEQLLEKRVRDSTHALEQSWPNLRLTRRASEAADKNLDVIKEKYARGRVTILDLLDAQNQSLNRKEEATLAVYTYLSDLVEYQRALSWFEMDKTPEDRQAFLNELQTRMTH